MTVTREPEWDDHERAKMLALVEYEAGICDCGLHESVADTDPDLELNIRICPACAGYSQQMRRMQASDDKAKGPKPNPAAAWPEDGRQVGLRPKATTGRSTPR